MLRVKVEVKRGENDDLQQLDCCGFNYAGGGAVVADVVGGKGCVNAACACT